MAENELLMRLMQACAQAGPAPFFLSEFAATSGLARADIDAAVDRLRHNGYLRIVDWVQGKGQGYAPTSEGIEALKTPAELRKPVAAPAQPTIDDRIWQRGETVRQALVEPGPPVVTMVLLFANLAMFAVGVFVGVMRGVSMQETLFGGIFGGRSLAFGQLMDSLGAVDVMRVIGANEWWRLVSHLFLHSGLIHLGMNMLGLFMLGPLLEAMWGSKRFLYLYLMSGVIGGATVVIVGRAGAVGASGALSGMITSLGVWLWLNRGSLPEQYRAQMSASVGTSLLMLILISMQANVSWEGHLGGALGGLLLSVPLHYQRFGNLWQRLLSWLGFVIIPLAAVALAYQVHARERPAMVSQVRFGAALPRVDRVILRHHNDVIVPLFDRTQPKLERDPVFVKKGRTACDEVAAAVGPLLDDLAKECAPEESVQANEVRQAQAYFQHCHELFRTLDGYFQDSKGWNQARMDVLSERVNTAIDLRKPLESSTILPRLPKLERIPRKGAPQPESKLPADVG